MMACRGPVRSRPAGGISLALVICAAVLASSLAVVSAGCPGNPSDCSSRQQFCGALSNCDPGEYRAGCRWENITDVFCPECDDSDPDVDCSNWSPDPSECTTTWSIDSHEGSCASCSNKPTYSSYTGHGGLSNSCPYSCTYETTSSGCTTSRQAPWVAMGAAEGYNGEDNFMVWNSIFQGEFRRYLFSHPGEFGYRSSAVWKSTDNSGSLNWNKLWVKEPEKAEAYLGNFGYGIQTVNLNLNASLAFKASQSYSASWMEDRCSKLRAQARDAVGEITEGEGWVCPTETSPTITLSDESIRNSTSHAVIDFNKRAISYANNAKLNWTDTSRNGVPDERLAFLTKILSGNFTVTASDSLPLQISVYCSLDEGRDQASDWGTISDSCVTDMDFCPYRNSYFIPNTGVNALPFQSTTYGQDLNRLTGRVTRLDCGLNDLSVANHRLQVMVRNVDTNLGYSLRWINYNFAIYDPDVVFGGGGEKDSAWASSSVHIPFTTWDHTVVIEDPLNVNDGLVLVSRVRPWLKWVAEPEGMPVKRRGCMIEVRNETTGALLSTYQDCSSKSDGSGSWRPSSWLGNGQHTFRMKVEDWQNNWVVVKKTFTIDTSQPTLTFVDQFPDVTYETSREIKFSVDEPSCSFKWRQTHTYDNYGNSTQPSWSWNTLTLEDDGVTQDQGAGYGQGTTSGTILLEDLGLGRHVFEIIPIDSAGNEGSLKTLIWEVSPQISHDTSNELLIRHFVVRSSRMEEHCEVYDHCTKTVSFHTEYTGGSGFVSVEIDDDDLPDWISASTTQVSDRKFQHVLRLSVEDITEPSQLSHKLKVAHVDKNCPTQGDFKDYCTTGGPETVDGFYINTTNLVRPSNYLEIDVRLHTYEPPTLELEPDDFVRKLSGGIELDITKQSNATLQVKNTGDFPLQWKMVYSSGSGAVDECGLDEQKEYIGSKPSWITVKDLASGSVLSDIVTVEAKSSKGVMIDFDTQQLRTANYRVALIMQTNDYDLSEDREFDNDQGYMPSLYDYQYNGCNGEYDCRDADDTECVSGQSWGYIRDIGGNTCGQTFSNSGQRILRPLADQVSNEEMGFRYLALDIEGMGANTLIFLPKKLNKAYVAAGTEVRQAVNLVSMVGASDAYFIYDQDSFMPQYDGLMDKPFWVYLSMTKLDLNRETKLVNYEREPFLDDQGNVNSTLLTEMISDGTYPDVLNSAGSTTEFTQRLQTWLMQTSGTVSRFNVEANLVQKTDISNTGGGSGMLFGIPVELDVNFRFYEKYTDLTRATVDCLMSGQQREKCLQLYSMSFTVENSNDHYYGTWPEPLGICQTLQGLDACTTDTVGKYQKGKADQIEVEVEFEPGLCSVDQSVLVVNSSNDGGLSVNTYTRQVRAGEEVELVIHTRDYLGNDRWPPEFCRSSVECRAPCTYEKTKDDVGLVYEPIQFGSYVALGEWPIFAAQHPTPIFRPSSALSEVERQELQITCNGNPQNGNFGVEFFTRTPLVFYSGFGGDFGDGGAMGSKELTYIVFDRLVPGMTRCWDARALLSWIEDPVSWHNEDMRHYPLDKHLLLSQEDITTINNIANGIRRSIDGITYEENFMKVDTITQWSYSEDNGDGTHSIKIPALKAGTYNVYVGEYNRTFVESTPLSLGVPTILGGTANVSNFYRTEDLDYAPLAHLLQFSEAEVQQYVFEVVASVIDLQSSLVLSENPIQQIAGEEFCFSVQAQDQFENVVRDQSLAVALQFYMLYKEESYKNSTIVAYESTYTQANTVTPENGLTYETCFKLERAGHYELWVAEEDAFVGQSLEDIQIILSRGGDGQAKRLNKHVPQETIILPAAVSEQTSCIDEHGVSKWTCGNQTNLQIMKAGDPLKFMLHAHDIYGNPLQSSSNYTFIGRVWGNVTAASNSTEEVSGEDVTDSASEGGDASETSETEGDTDNSADGEQSTETNEGRRSLLQTVAESPWTEEVATGIAYPSNVTECSDPYFGKGSTCPNEFVLIISSELTSSEWFGPKGNGTYKLTIDVIQYLPDGTAVEKNIGGIQYMVQLNPSNLISPANTELYSGLTPPLSQPYLDGRSLPPLRFKEEYEGLFVMPKDRFGNFLSLPVESNILSSGVPLSASDVLLTLFDNVRNGEVLSSDWSFRGVYDKDRSELTNAVVFSLEFSPRMNGTYEFNVSINDGEDVSLINGNPFELPVLEILCEEGSQAERQTGAYCVCSPGWYDQLTADLGDLPDCQRCGIELSGELDLTKYNTRPDQIECIYCPLCSDGQTYEYAPIGADSPYDCRCPDDFVRIPHLTSEEFPLNEFGRHLCHPCPDGAICTNGTNLAGIEAEDGYWRADNETDTFVSCDLTIAGAQICVGGAIEEGYCMDGHTGDLCTECDEGWGRAGRGTCIKCVQGTTRTIFDWFQIVGTVVGLTLLVTVFVYREIKSMHSKIKSGDFARSRARTQLLKSMLSYLQIVGIAKEVQVQWNPLLRKYFNTVNSMTSEFAFESQAFACQLPSSYMQKWQAYMLAPFFASAGLLIVFYFRSVFKPKKDKGGLAVTDKDLKDEVEEDGQSTFLTSFMTTMLVLGFLAYPSLVRKAVEVFGCRTMVQTKTDRRDNGNVIDSAISLLSVDNSVSCLSTEYTLMRLQAMVAIALYGVGVPFSVFLAIKARRHQLNEKKTMLMFGFMYSGYKDQFWWWECMSLMRKLFMSLVLVFFSERLYIQLFLGLVVSQMFLLLQLRYKPFTNDLCNIFETMSLFALWFTLQGTFLYFEGVSIGVNLVITVCLASINFGVILFFVLSYFYQTLEDKKEALRRPLGKIGVDIDWVLDTVRKLNREIVDSTVSKNVVKVFAKQGGVGVEDLMSFPQKKQIETFKKILEVYDVSEATDEELQLVQDVHAKLEEILNSDEALRLTYDSPLMEGIQEYINRLRSESGAAYVNPLSSFDSLADDRRTRELKKHYGEAGLLEGISTFLSRHRSETGRNFQNPLAEEGDGQGLGMGALGPLTEVEEPAPGGEGMAPARKATAETSIMDDISTFLTRFRSETGRNFQNPLATEGDNLDASALSVEIQNSTKSLKDELAGTRETEHTDTLEQLANVTLRSTPVNPDDTSRKREDTFKFEAPELKKTQESERKKSMDYLHRVDSELLKILNWRSEIAETGRYKPLSNAKVKHIHRHSVHHGRQRAMVKGMSMSVAKALEGINNPDFRRSPAPQSLPSIEETEVPATPASQGSSEGPGTPGTPGEHQSLLSSRDREDSAAISVNPLANSLWKKAVSGARAEVVANPLRGMGEEGSAGDRENLQEQSGPALPKSLTLDRTGSSRRVPEPQPELDLESGPVRKGSEQEMNLNPMLQDKAAGKKVMSLPTTLTLKKASKQFKNLAKKKKKGKR